VLFAPRELPPLRADAGSDTARYQEWVVAREMERRAGSPAQTSRSVDTDEAPGLVTFDVLVPLTNEFEALAVTVASLISQTSPHWHLIAVDQEPTPIDLATGGRALGTLDTNHYSWVHSDAGSEGERLDDALFHGTGTAVMVLSPGDRLTPDALALLSGQVNLVDASYGDEDEINSLGQLSRPKFKPDWSLDFLLSTPYLGRPFAVRRDVLERAGGFHAPGLAEWEHDLMLRVSDHVGLGGISHVAEVLCHRPLSSTAESERSPSPARATSSVTAVQDWLDRRGEKATAERGPGRNGVTVHRVLPLETTVSTVIPFRNGAAYLRSCVDTVTATVGNVQHQFILVDNGSTEPEMLTLLERFSRRDDVVILRDDRPFNWAQLNNRAAEHSASDVLLFLNNDITAIRAGWLEQLCAHVLRTDVGVAGARLLYPDNRVQHAGVVLGIGGAAGHVLAGLGHDEPGYLDMAVLTRDCSAVTGACLAIERSHFHTLGGFDETFGLDMNDIDLCLRSLASGQRVIFEPQAELVHYESPSRGTSGSVDNISTFIDRWEQVVERGDPHLNINLTRVDSSCAIRGPDEEGWWRQWRATLKSL
jgi:O-antigen biosynthesis protein